MIQVWILSMVAPVFWIGQNTVLKRAIALVLAVAMATALAGCNIAEFRGQTAQVPRFVVTSLSDPKTFNTILSTEENEALDLMYDGLLSTNGLTGELEPGLAESYEISPDQLHITFKLRDGLKWSDGEPMTVDDVVFTYNDIIFNENIPSSSADIFRIGAEGKFPVVRKVDDRRVEFVSPEPFAPLLRFAGSPFLPKHALEKYIRSTGPDGKPRFLTAWGTDTNPKEIIGSGPYRIKSYQPGERVILERNPYYWRKDAQGNQQPYIEQYVVQVVGSTDASLMQFRSGGTDAEGITPDYFALMKQQEKQGRFKIYNGGPTLSVSFLTFNLNKGKLNGKPVVDPIKARWFNSLEFRQAIAHAIDRPTMINSIYQGLGVPQNSPMYIQSPYYLPPEKGLPTYDYNPEKAKQLLAQAGFKQAPDGKLLDAEGHPVRFTLATNAGNKIREAMGVRIRDDLSKLGITVDFQPIAFNTLVGRLRNSLDWEACILGFVGAGIDPDGFRNSWSPSGQLHHFNRQPDSGKLEGREVSDWEKQIYQLYVEAGQQLDDNKRKAIYAEAQKVVQQNLPFIYLITPYSLTAARDRVQGIRYSALGGIGWNIYELKLSEK